MTTCDPPKIRSLIEKHLGKDKAKKYDTVVEHCKLGNALKDSRTWAPLCPAYPNLKGVTCEEIEDCISIGKTVVPKYIYTKDHYNMIKTMDRYNPEESLTDEQEESLEKKFAKLYAENVISNMDSEPTRPQLKLIDSVAHSIFWTSTRSPVIFDNNFYYDTYYALELDPTEEPSSVKEKYFHNVKVYDRDEEYAAFKKIGEWIEEDTPGILHDLSTIFVTTPRGGHEMLSIFTYANDISKKQIPSDIRFQHMTTGAPVSDQSYKENPISAAKYIGKKGYEEDEKIPTDIYGTDWMYHRSLPVKNIFIIDDIIASGEQIHKTAMSLEEMFPDATINSVTLCKRDKTYPALPAEVKKYYSDVKTIGIEEFKNLQGKRKIFDNEYVTCLFPHACPDGRSDKLMVELMGGDRCPPEKRISRRDL